MTAIEDTAITVISGDLSYVGLRIGVDVRFTAQDLLFAQLGFNKWSVLCTLWDEDTFLDDRIALQEHVMEPGSIQELTGIEIDFLLLKEELQKIENAAEHHVELYGKLYLVKDGIQYFGGNTSTISACIFPICFLD